VLVQWSDYSCVWAVLLGEEIQTFQRTAVTSSSGKSRAKIPLLRLVESHDEGPAIFQRVRTTVVLISP
jgi:hypothetical protein